MNLPPIISRKLRSLRRALWTYVVVDGIATTVTALLLLFWLDLGLDRFFEFSRLSRSVLLIGFFGLLVYIVWLRILRRLRNGPDDRQLALVFEHFEPGLDESLITAVELDEPVGGETFDPDLYRQSVRQAGAGLKSIDIRKFFRYGRLWSRIAVAVILLAMIGGFCVRYAETAELWFSRNILLSDRDWPRRSRLVVEGFHDGRVRIGRGDSFTLTVRADTGMPLIPETIRLRLGNRESGYRTVLVDQFRIDTLNGTEWRTFSHTFAEMLETLPLSIRGADTTLDDLEIEVVPPPMLTGIRLHQKFPAYMDRPDRTVSPGSRVTIPDGVSVTIEAETNKPLKKATVTPDKEDPRSIDAEAVPLRYSMENLRNDVRLDFQLEDTDLLRNRQPIRFDFTILKDRPPTVTARLDGIGSAITPNAVLPVLGELADDYGLATVRFRYSVEQDKIEETPVEETENAIKTDEGSVDIGGIGAMQTLFSLNEHFSVSDSTVNPGDKLSLWIEATDRFDLDGEPGQTGLGQRWTLEIVPPERLRSLLEVREISLRQRFEVLIGEVELTKNLVEEIVLDAPEELVREAEALALPESDETAEETQRRREELEMKRKTLLETISKEQSDAGRYNISRVLRDTQKETYEIRTIIESFRLIRAEMVNNRIFTDDDQNRLDRGIVTPMQALVDTDFPDIDQGVELLNQSLTSVMEGAPPRRSVAVDRRQEAVDGFDELIKKMTAIRDNMVSMESFNEAIDILRAIIRQQQQIRQETIEEKNQRLKNLLE